MDERIQRALARDRVIDITTIGRKSGEARRIEIWFHNWAGRLFITGLPGKRSWYANLVAHPEFTFHLKESARADLPARATPITGEAQRREILAGILQTLDQPGELEAWVKDSPLVEVTLL
ncbi:MAG: nitroreductase/quinone reductase family protein [Chloroflexi bacterium]|nr:nitroreductase/quinone reductase family protein [Chloroflexota bacterium]